MNTQAIVAKLLSLKLDARVRADGDIVYATSGIEIASDSRGTIKDIGGNGGVVAVLWDGMAEAVWTSFDSIEVLSS